MAICLVHPLPWSLRPDGVIGQPPDICHCGRSLALPRCGRPVRDSHAAAAQVWDPERVIIIPDHYIFTSDPRANRNVDILRCAEYLHLGHSTRM